MGTQQFCLRWNNHQTNLLAVFDQLLQNEAFVDVTLACEGLSIKAHKMVLSACSPYFQSLFIDNPCQHPIVILKDVRFSELKAVVDFMYKGEVNVSQDQLSALLKTAETLKVKGLAEVTGSSPSGDVTRSALGSAALSSGQGPGGGGGGGGSSGGGTLPAGASDGRLSPPAKRKRRLTKRPSTEDGDLEVVESLVDVVTDGPSSVPTTQERTLDGGVTSMKSDTVDTQGVTPTTQTDQPHNATAEMNYDGVNQEHTSNSRDSGMMLVDHAQSSSSSSIGQLPATASTSRMSPAQGGNNWPTVPTYKIWTKESMFTALKAVFARRMSYQQACDHFCIPVPTFYYYMSRVRKTLKPLEREDYESGSSSLAADQMNIKGRHGKSLNIAESDLNAAIMNVVCRSGKLAIPADSEPSGATPRANFSPTSPANDEALHPTLPAADLAIPLLQGDEFMNRMNVKPRGRQRSWKQEDMYSAIKAIITRQMSLAKASRQFGIPYPTLKVYLKKAANMSKPPEWGDTDTPTLSGWTGSMNAWPNQDATAALGDKRSSEGDDTHKNEFYNRKLAISEVYSESTSNSSQDEEEEEDEAGDQQTNDEKVMANALAQQPSSITFEPVPKGLVDEAGDLEPCLERIPKVEMMEESSEDGEGEEEDDDDEEDEEDDDVCGQPGGDDQQEDKTHENGAKGHDNGAVGHNNGADGHDNEEEEVRDSRPPWIEVLTLD